MADVILVLNAGSSSLKYCAYDAQGDALRLVLRGSLDGLYTSPTFRAADASGTEVETEAIEVRSSLMTVTHLSSEQQIHRAARVAEDLRSGHDLVIRAPTRDLSGCVVQLSEKGSKVGAALVRSFVGEEVAGLVDLGLGRLTPGLGQRGEFAAGLRGDGDETLVLKLADRGVDRAGAWRPAAVATLGDRLHELVSVHGLLSEKGQDRDTYVTATHAGPS